jgi:hypothetical protein
MSAHKRPFQWNARLERRLRGAIADGMTRAECARLLGASDRAVARKEAELGIKSGRLDLSSAAVHGRPFDVLESEEQV